MLNKINQKNFNKFFKKYSKNVDNADKHFFWKLSDQIILEIMKKHIPVKITEKSIILDAGGGTGRWTTMLSKIYKSNFVLYDLSQDMLTKAKENIIQANIVNRISIIKGDLCNMKIINDASVDYIISIYNPISFIRNKKKALSELYRILKKEGILFIMGQGYYNALFSKINNYFASYKELKTICDKSMVKWNTHVPNLNVFSCNSIEELLKETGFKIVSTYGIPVLVQPGPEDFDSENKLTSKISHALKTPSFYKKVLELEMKFNNKPDVVNRGMNLMSVVKK